MNHQNLFNIIIYSLLILIILLILSNLLTNFNQDNMKPTSSLYNKELLREINELKKQINEKNKEQPPILESQPIPQRLVLPPAIPIAQDNDVINIYDRKTAYDPMYEPSRRPPRHQIDMIIGNPSFNYPTRGFTDTYSLQGYLVKNKELKEHGDNKIIRLYGREKFPNSTEYEYYVIINNGPNDEIKYFLEDQRKELYNGDSVYIDILQSTYFVKLLKNKTMLYNPYFI